MNCNVVKDLIPLCVDGCCSEESEKTVKEHIENCPSCKKIYEDMNTPTEFVAKSTAPQKFNRLNDFKASVMQSVLLFFSFALITVGVAVEARTPLGFSNSLGAFNIVIPSTAFMLSLANWYFVRVYKSRKIFSNCSMLLTLSFSVIAYIWGMFHYEANLFELLFSEFPQSLPHMMLFYGFGVFLTVVFCVLSKVLSNKYAKMLGKE